MKAAIIAGCVVLSVLTTASGAHAEDKELELARQRAFSAVQESCRKEHGDGILCAELDAPYPKSVKTEKHKPAGIVRECTLKYSADGTFENKREAEACVRNWNATIADPAKGRWTWSWRPPAEYDIPYTGILMIQRLPIDEVHKVCAPNQLACATPFSTRPDGRGTYISITGDRVACLIIMPTDDYIRKHSPQIAEGTLRHEMGHCNGWPADHPRSQPK